MLPDRPRIRAKIKHATHAADDRSRIDFDPRKPDVHPQAIVSIVGSDADHALRAIQCDRPLIARGTVNALDTRIARAARKSMMALQSYGGAYGKSNVMPAAADRLTSRALARRNSRGGRSYSAWNVALNRRTLPKPDTSATSASGICVSTISCFAKSTRRVCATAIGDAPRCCLNSRRTWRSPTPNRSASASTASPSSAPSPMSASARDTVFDVPRQMAKSANFPAGNAGKGDNRLPVRRSRSDRM